MKLSNKALKICIMFLLLVTTVFGERLVVLPGSIQGALGGTNWDPAGAITKMTKVGDDLYEFSAEFPVGNYEYKVAIDGVWTENYGKDGAQDGGNISITIPQNNTPVKFTFNYKTKEIKHEVKIEGFNLIPILTNKVEQKGKDAKYAVTNEFELGILSQNLEVKSKFSYNFDYNKDTKKSTNLGSDADIKNLKIEELTADYKMGPVTTGIMVNKTNIKGSNDYFGVLDVSKATDDRDNTRNPEDISSNNIGVKLSTEKFAKMDISVSRYVPDIYSTPKSTRTLSQLNIEKSLLKDKLTLGTSNIFYQVTHNNEDEDLLINGSLYGKMNIGKNLTFKGQVLYVPTGSILDNTEVRIVKIGADKWEITLDPVAAGIDDEITEVHMVGDLPLATWNPADFSYPLVKQPDGTFFGTFDVPEGKQFKFIYDAKDWSQNIGIGGKDGGNFTMEETKDAPGLKNGINGYLAELNYKLNDKGNVTFGTKALNKGVYMPFAKDEVLDDNKTGYAEYYLNGDYKIAKNAKVLLEKTYKTEEDTSKMLSDRYKLGFDIWSIPVVEYAKGHYLIDKEDEDEFKGKVNEAFFETKFNKLPLVKYAKINTTQRLDTETSQYTIETELKDTLYFISHIKGNLTYAKDDVYYGFQGGDALQYFAEIKFADIPGIYSFVPYITVSYESDDNGNDGIVERKAYFDKDDNDNDWLKKIKVETKLAHESLTKWNGLTISYETRKIEESKTKDAPKDFAKDEQYYVASARTFVDWYSILTLSTGYTLPKDIKAKVTYKYDFAHQNRAEFEDDGLKLELEKKFGKTTVNASYNTKDKDEGRDYTKVVFRTVF